LEKSIRPTAPRLGKAGELRVRSELILNGFSPAVCDDDDGTDIILADNGKKLQVKTSFQPQYNQNYAYKYSFSIRQTQFRKGKEGHYTRSFTRKNYLDKADYFIFYLVEHNMFYIVPENEIGAKVSFTVPTPGERRIYKRKDQPSKSKYEKYRNAWHLLS
jgi:hypothetical protein